MLNFKYKELRFENLCQNGIIAIYDTESYRLVEKTFSVIPIENFNSLTVIFKTAYNYIFEDNKSIRNISKYLLNKYKDDIVFLVYFDNISNNYTPDLLEDKQLYTEISIKILKSYKDGFLL